MTIKPGTLCFIKSPAHASVTGRIVVVTGPSRVANSIGIGGNHSISEVVYPIDWIGQEPVHPYINNLSGWVAPRNILVPFNDPDSAPADPAYTKRRQHA